MYCFGKTLGNVEDGADEYFRVYPEAKAAIFCTCGWILVAHREDFVTRRNAGILSAALLLASTLTASPLLAQSSADQSGMPKVGDMAPDFTLKYFDGNDLKEVKLSDYRGKKSVVLAFFVFAFTGG